MFAHQVIEDLQKRKHKQSLMEDKNIMICELKNSFKFYLGELTRERIVNIAEGDHFNKYRQYLKMPYEKCWLDYRFKEINSIDGKMEAPKRGMLVRQYSPEKILVSVFFYLPMFKLWIMPYLSYAIHMDKINSGRVECMVLKGVSSFVSYAQIQQSFREDTVDLKILEEFMLLVNSKNIETSDNHPPLKLNLARRKKGKQELYTYKTLHIKLPVKRRDGTDSSSGLDHNRIHFCRGHFKEYTSDNPLFGKVTGLWWWSPHVRGKNKEGIVEKDYVCNFTHTDGE